MQPTEFYKNPQDIYPGINTSPRLAKVARLARKYASGARSLLDIGCGDGTFAAELRHLLGAQEAVGVEVSSAAAEAANKHGVAAQVVDIDKGNLPFESASFDFIYCGEVIEHLYDPDHLLDEIHRLLAPKGVAILDTPNLASLLNRFALQLGYQPFLTDVSLRHNVGKLRTMGSAAGSGHIRVFTKRALEQLLVCHEFSILEVRGCKAVEPAYGLSYPFAWEFLDGLISRIPGFAVVVIVVFRKAGV